MKILFVCTDFNRSGAALAMIELAEKVKMLGNDVLLLYPGYGDAVEEAIKRGQDYRVIRSYEWVKPLVRKESLRIKTKWLLKHIYNLIAIKQIEHLIKQEKVEIVHVNTLWGYVGAVAARRTNTPYVWHMRELLEQQQQQQLRWKKYGEKLIGDAEALIAISKLVENNYSGRFPEDKIHLIYDGVDVDKMYRENHPLFKGHTIKVMIAGGVRPAKRQMDVIRAVEILANKGKDIELSVVGADDTEYAATIKEYVKTHNLGNKVTFLGETDNVAAYWEKNDISITSSEFEAFGRVTAEAMLTGCVVVVSNSGANEEIVTDGETGYVYELGSPESLAAAIERVLADRSRAEECAIAGRESVKLRFSSEKNATQVVELYKTVLRRGQ